MKEYANLFYLPMWIFYLAIGFKAFQLGRTYVRGEKSYKSWLKAEEYLNKNVGWHFFLGGGLMLLVSISGIIATFFDVFAKKETFLEALACLGLPILLITGVSFYMLRERILQLEPKPAIENKNLGQDDV
ncbi:MAG: hypothetical protein R3D55_10885 [Chloroflexota bacterium]